MKGTMEQVTALVSEYPDTPHRRKILTMLGDVNEQLNGFLFGLAMTQGYRFESVHGANGNEVLGKND